MFWGKDEFCHSSLAMLPHSYYQNKYCLTLNVFLQKKKNGKTQSLAKPSEKMNGPRLCKTSFFCKFASWEKFPPAID